MNKTNVLVGIGSAAGAFLLCHALLPVVILGAGGAAVFFGYDYFASKV
jgi:hypothetical protein